MAHEDEGNYKGKHEQVQLNETIAEHIRRKAAGSNISCSNAHNIAKELNTRPEDVGIAIDLMEIKITGCQLGFFGAGRTKKDHLDTREINPEIKKAIEAGLEDGRLPCKTAWDIAANAGVPKIAIADACEKLKIKISRCQLGTF